MKNLITKIFLTSLIILIIPFSLTGQEFPKPVGYVNDFANVIPPSYEQEITKICLELDQKTGAQIADVTIPTLGDNYIEDYAVRLFEKWGIGQKGKDNGVLILNAVKERKIRIEVGYGLEGILPDSKAGRIRDQYLIPYLKKGEYGKGHLYTVTAIAKEIAKEYGVQLTGNVKLPPPRASKSRGAGSFLGILFFLFLILITRGRILPWLLLGSMMGGGGRSRGGWGGGGFGGGFGGFGGGMSGGGGVSGSY